MKTESNRLGNLYDDRAQATKVCSVNDLTILLHDGEDAKV